MVNPDPEEGVPDEIDRIAESPGSIREGWQRTIEDARAMAADREEAGYETMVLFSQDTSPVAPGAAGGDADRPGASDEGDADRPGASDEGDADRPDASDEGDADRPDASDEGDPTRAGGSSDGDAWGLTYLVDGDTADEFAVFRERAEFDESAVYQGGADDTVFIVTESIDHDAELVLLVAGAFRRREAVDLVRGALEREEMHTHIRLLDGTVVGSVAHDDPAAFFPEPGEYLMQGGERPVPDDTEE